MVDMKEAERDFEILKEYEGLENIGG